MTQAKSQNSLAQEMAFLVKDLYMLAGTDISAPHPVLQCAAQGDLVKLGMCIAASVLQQAISSYPVDLVAHGDLADKPGFDNLQSK